MVHPKDRELLGFIGGALWGASGAAKRHPKHPVVGGTADATALGIGGLFLANFLNAYEGRQQYSESTAAMPDGVREAIAYGRGTVMGFSLAMGTMQAFEELFDQESARFESLPETEREAEAKRFLLNRMSTVLALLERSIRKEAAHLAGIAQEGCRAAGVNIDFMPTEEEVQRALSFGSARLMEKLRT